MHVAEDRVFAIECDAIGRDGHICESLRQGGTCVGSRHRVERRQVRSNIAARRLVAFPCGNFHGFRCISDLCQLGSIPEQPLHIWPLHLAVLFTRTLRQLPACLVWAETELVPKFPALLSGPAGSLDTRPVPPDLLLLPRGVLQVVLGRSSGVRGERAPQELSGGTNLSAHYAELSPLLSEVFVHCLGLSGLRRRKGVLFSGGRRNRDRKPGSGSECRASGRICIWVSRVPAHDRRDLRPNLGSPGTAQDLQLREPPECWPQEVGLGEPALGCVFRYLCPPMFNGHLA